MSAEAAAAAVTNTSAGQSADGAGGGQPATEGASILESAATEGKTEGGEGQSTEGQADTGAGKAAEGGEESAGAPEAYDTFEMPDGVTIDDTSLGEFSELAKATNMTQESAQQAVNIATKAIEQALAKQAEATEQHYDTQRESWLAEIDNDPNKLQINADAMVAAKAFVSPELGAYLTESNAGNNPLMIRMFADIGKRMAEDKMSDGNSAGETKSTADVLFGPDSVDV